MPSKRGNRAVLANVAPVASTLSSPLPFVAADATVVASEDTGRVAFDAAELVRPLRRGLEVDRFNELARREQSLTTEESEELYRFRIRRLLTRGRQLERAMAAGNEDSIREAVGDFRGRLAELVDFESIRRRAGLSTEYAVDRTVEERAVASLLTLAASRPHGLIAGADQALEQPAGSVRIPEAAFEPSANDVPVYIVAPASIPSDALARHVEATASQGARIRVIRDPSEIPHGDVPPLVLNWGAVQAFPHDLITLNRPEAVQVSSDQVESLRRLRELAPRTVVNPEDLGLLGSAQAVAKTRHGSRGSGKAVIQVDAPVGDRAGYDLYQEFIPDRREYRISLLSDRIVSAYVKHPPEGGPREDLRPAWTFERAQVIPRAAAIVARQAVRRIGLDYAGVDVVEDVRTGRFYCLEANAAPGMSEDTLKSLYGHVQQTLRGQLARAV